MGGEGSGRRESYETTAILPDAIGESEEEIGAYVNAVALGVVTGGVEARIADTLKDLARTKLAAIRQKSERQKVDDLWEILKRAEALAAEGISYEEAVRQHRADPLIGRWRVTTDADGREAFVNDGEDRKPAPAGAGKKSTPRRRPVR